MLTLPCWGVSPRVAVANSPAEGPAGAAQSEVQRPQSVSSIGSCLGIPALTHVPSPSVSDTGPASEVAGTGNITSLHTVKSVLCTLASREVYEWPLALRVRLLQWLVNAVLLTDSFQERLREPSTASSGEAQEGVGCWRLEPLGCDSAGNRYWCFSPDKCTGQGGLFVERRADGRWGQCASLDAVCTLARSIDFRKSRAQVGIASWDRVLCGGRHRVVQMYVRA